MDNTGFIRQLRVYEFNISRPGTTGVQVIAMERSDGLRRQMEMALKTEAARECRPRNLPLLVDPSRKGIIVTGAGCTPHELTEMIRIVNSSGFRGEFLLLNDHRKVPAHILMRAKKIALDFDLGTTSVTSLVERVYGSTNTDTDHLLVKTAVG